MPPPSYRSYTITDTKAARAAPSGCNTLRTCGHAPRYLQALQACTVAPRDCRFCLWSPYWTIVLLLHPVDLVHSTRPTEGSELSGVHIPVDVPDLHHGALSLATRKELVMLDSSVLTMLLCFCGCLSLSRYKASAGSGAQYREAQLTSGQRHRTFASLQHVGSYIVDSACSLGCPLCKLGFYATVN